MWSPEGRWSFSWEWFSLPQLLPVDIVEPEQTLLEVVPSGRDGVDEELNFGEGTWVVEQSAFLERRLAGDHPEPILNPLDEEWRWTLVSQRGGTPPLRCLVVLLGSTSLGE